MINIEHLNVIKTSSRISFKAKKCLNGLFIALKAIVNTEKHFPYILFWLLHQA